MPLGRRAWLRGCVAAVASTAGCERLGRPTERRRRTSRRGEPTRTTAAEGISVQWARGPDMPERRTQTTAVALDGKLYVVGGIVEDGERTLGVYDPGAERWSEASPPPKPVNHAAAVAHGGRIHVLGGYSGSFLGGPPLSAHWVYDPAGDDWSDAPPLPTPRGAMVAGVVDGRIYAVGGATEEGTTDLVEVYDIAEGSWSTAAPMPTAREHLSAGVIDGAVYVAGGRRGLGPMVDAAERYDPDADSWTELAPMPTARAGIAGDTLAGRLFVFGGEEVGERVFGEVEAYHPPSDAWTAVEPLPTPRWGLGVATLGNRIYTVGGGAVPSAEETRTLEVMSIEG